DEYIKNIETVLNREDAPSVVEEYLRGGLDRVDGISESAVGVITSLSDDLIERGLKTVENIKAVPGAISQRAKEAIDRRIVRVATANPEQASEAILDLYKRSVV